MLTGTRVLGVALVFASLPAARAADPSPITTLSFRNADGKAVAWKDVSGKTATGIVRARYTPTATSVRMTKMIGLPWRAVQ